VPEVPIIGRMISLPADHIAEGTAFKATGDALSLFAYLI
jgi:hypothetical protein